MLHVKQGKFKGILTDVALGFPYETDDFQKHSFESINNRHHLLVTAHTGSGKTTIAEYAVAYAIRQNKKVIYTTPIKALSNQIYKDFRHKYPKWSVGIRTGDIDMNSDAQVLIMTTEILRNMLYSAEESSVDTSDVAPLISTVSTVIFDEVHYIKDRDRGTVWEESLILMPTGIQMVMLSATLPDAEQFGTWIAQTKKVDTDYVTTSHRVVPLTHNIFLHDRLVPIMDNMGSFNNTEFIKSADKYSFVPSELNKYVKHLQSWNLLPAFFFCFSRNLCEKYAKSITVSLVDSKTSTQIENIFNQKLAIFGDRFNGMRQVFDLKGLLCKGIGYHHSGLLPILKEIVEILFSEGLIQILFVTETFAAGVNMPTKTVVFTGLSKYDGYSQDFRDLYPEEYLQMAGRAGRRGLDEQGTVILLPFRNFPDLSQVRSIMCGQLSPINSRFNMNYKFLIRVLATDNLDVLAFSGKTLLKNEMDDLTIKLRASIDELTDQIKIMTKGEKEEYDQETLYIINYFMDGTKKTRAEQKQYKKFVSGMDPKTMDQLVDKATTVLADRNDLQDNQKRLSALTNQLASIDNGMVSHISDLISFLYEGEYIDMKDQPISSFGRDNLMMKGLLANEVNECDEVLLTELVYSGKLDTLNFQEIVSVVASLIDVKDSGREVVLSQKVCKARQYLVCLIPQMIEVEETCNTQHTDWCLSIEFCDLAYVWAEGGDMNDIFKLDPNVHAGNFVRMILKLKNICTEIVKMCSINQNNALAKILENYEQKLIRGIVIPDSLYVR